VQSVALPSAQVTSWFTAPQREQLHDRRAFGYSSQCASDAGAVSGSDAGHFTQTVPHRDNQRRLRGHVVHIAYADDGRSARKHWIIPRSPSAGFECRKAYVIPARDSLHRFLESGMLSGCRC
jgi:hypothetical protein